jgi:hypothetical protein
MVELKPQPELVVVLVQIMDNDIVCPAKASDFAAFPRTLISALRIIAKRSPPSRMFLVSQFGSPQTWWKQPRPSSARRSAAPASARPSTPGAGSSSRGTGAWSTASTATRAS